MKIGARRQVLAELAQMQQRAGAVDAATLDGVLGQWDFAPASAPSKSTFTPVNVPSIVQY